MFYGYGFQIKSVIYELVPLNGNSRVIEVDSHSFSPYKGNWFLMIN